MAKLAFTAAVVLAASLAPGIVTAQEPPTAVAPDLTGLSISEARAVIEGTGLQLDYRIRWVVRPGFPRRVVAQNPEPGRPWYVDGGNSIDVSTGLRPSGRVALEFRTTGGGAYCQVQTSDPVDELVCWHPRTGRIVTMSGGTGFGAATSRFHRGAIGARPAGFRTVGFGASWRRSFWNCYSTRQALTCSVDQRHFFRLGRARGFMSRGD